MSKANALGGLLGMLIPIYGVLIGVAGAPAWVMAIIVLALGAYWAYGRRLLFANEKDQFPESRVERRAERKERRSGRFS